jgi:23S rRNA (adenine2503-C2)-methyltransferase
MRHWLEVGRNELAGWLAEAGQPAYRAEQFLRWLHRERAAGFTAMKNLPLELRRILADAGSLRVLEERERRTAPDGLTAKLLFAAPGNAILESVLIVEKRLSRRTACLSCMAGCPLGCRFCATGNLGFVRNLTAGEIIEQAYR